MSDDQYPILTEVDRKARAFLFEIDPTPWAGDSCFFTNWLPPHLRTEEKILEFGIEETVLVLVEILVESKTKWKRIQELVNQQIGKNSGIY